MERRLPHGLLLLQLLALTPFFHAVAPELRTVGRVGPTARYPSVRPVLRAPVIRLDRFGVGKSDGRLLYDIVDMGPKVMQLSACTLDLLMEKKCRQPFKGFKALGLEWTRYRLSRSDKRRRHIEVTGPLIWFDIRTFVGFRYLKRRDSHAFLPSHQVKGKRLVLWKQSRQYNKELQSIEHIHGAHASLLYEFVLLFVAALSEATRISETAIHQGNEIVAPNINGLDAIDGAGKLPQDKEEMETFYGTAYIVSRSTRFVANQLEKLLSGDRREPQLRADSPVGGPPPFGINVGQPRSPSYKSVFHQHLPPFVEKSSVFANPSVPEDKDERGCRHEEFADKLRPIRFSLCGWDELLEMLNFITVLRSRKREGIALLKSGPYRVIDFERVKNFVSRVLPPGESPAIQIVVNADGSAGVFPLAVSDVKGGEMPDWLKDRDSEFANFGRKLMTINLQSSDSERPEDVKDTAQKVKNGWRGGRKKKNLSPSSVKSDEDSTEHRTFFSNVAEVVFQPMCPDWHFLVTELHSFTSLRNWVV